MFPQLEDIANFIEACAGKSTTAHLIDLDSDLPEHARFLLEGASFTDRPYLSFTDADGSRHSALFLKSESATITAMIYVKQDFSTVINARNSLQDFLSEIGVVQDIPPSDVEEFVRGNIEKLVPGGVEQARAMGLEDKQKLLSTLNKKGVFNIKKAVEHATAQLDMATATVYRYLRADTQKDNQA